ncbi:DUF4159 domain-containing protein [Acetobacter suratthaniensis]|uniref:DUF4159 domain-containing protein n=1 Tax=Acetobacter suratthaniensis TaxID=1502841 RepID=A0ABS3LKQ3_9PROT|nr:DUF4159 domain-containing protein [Acetobacter suratthaniensis]MBO1327238.1 DUF4159 domain-containing protein [Acetobacter suratthaniensis]MCX2565150.1 DUF4159 domain-containing protein [Acetobacter suratthaniensis]
MSFSSPLLLLALVGLPLVWWLLRATPPQPRRQVFPPVALLAGLRTRQIDAVRSPLWLLVLRALVFCLLVIGLAGPSLHNEAETPPISGPVLLVMDNGLFAAPDWAERIGTAQAIVQRAARSQSPVTLLLTAPTPTEQPSDAPVIPQSSTEAEQALNALRPSPWPVNRTQAARQLGALSHRYAQVFYLADGVASPQDADFAQALRHTGAVREVRFPHQTALALTPPAPASGDVMAHMLALPAALPQDMTALARTADGATLAAIPFTLPAHATQADIHLALPPEVRNQVETITLRGIAGAATTLLMDETDRMRPVGLLSAGGADTPLVGALFYIRRALAPTTDLHEGNAETLLSRPLSVLIAPDGTLTGNQTQQVVRAWVEKGGTLIRFAGPALAGASHDGASPADSLLPVPLLDGTRQLGGSMTWGAPQKLAAFDALSPFRGLPIPADVTVSRQVLASPTDTLGEQSWARLADGTPLVTYATLGKGTLVLFHISSTADWSNLPLSGLFVSMLQRLTEHANGLAIPADDTLLSPALSLDGEGNLGPPPASARGLRASAFASTPVSPEHPPGLYGPRNGRRALNATAQITTLQAAEPIGTLIDPQTRQPDRPLGRYSLLAALVLMLVDGLAMLLMRVARRPSARGAAVVLLGCLLVAGGAAHAQAPDDGSYPLPPSARTAPQQAMPAAVDAAPPAIQQIPPVPRAALETRLAYVVTGHADVDDVSRQGLQGLSDFVNARTSAKLGVPDGIRPGQDDLSYYPLIYWPVTADAQTSPAITANLNSFMAHGGILLIDTQGDNASGEEGGPADASAGHALRRVTAGLQIPPLTTMTDHHLLAHTFYLLHDFPGRYAGQPIWVAREGDAENDDVSPVIIGSADWAHAWAVDGNGGTPYAVLPGGAEQRIQAYRFGLNAVIYALTGSYKADQVHVPMLLKRLENTP